MEAVVWDNAGGSAQNIHQSFTLSNFDGAAAQGTWTLTLIDGAAQDVGSLDSWKLQIVQQ